MKNNHEPHHTHKSDYLDEIDKVLEKHKLPQLTYYEIHHLTSSVNIKEIEFVT